MTKILMLLEDCHRPSNGGFDPLERLATIRAKFFDVRGQTLGDDVPITAQDGPFTPATRATASTTSLSPRRT